MSAAEQISAYISKSTKREIERYTEAHGVKKGHFIEQALLHHLQALRELPSDLPVPSQLKLTKESQATVAGLVLKPRRRTKAMRDLLAGKPVPGEPKDW